MQQSQPLARASYFVKYATFAYGVIILFASLYPLRGWREHVSESVWDRLTEWPRYYTYTDVWLNVIAYVPIGFLLTLLLRSKFTVMRASSLAIFGCVLLSLGMEIIQCYLPPRVPSALDVFCNGVGALLGAWAGIAVGEPWLLRGPLTKWRHEWLHHGAWTDFGLLALVIWALTQFQPRLWLFGTGDFAHVLWPVTQTADSFIGYALIEMGVTAGGILALSAIVIGISRSHAATVTIGFVLVALVLRSIACAFIFAGRPFVWVTPGALLGLIAGALLFWLLRNSRQKTVFWFGIVGLLLSVVFVNIAPANPYIDAAVITWRRGPFWSFSGTVRLISIVWPVLAAAYLMQRLLRDPSRTAPPISKR